MKKWGWAIFAAVLVLGSRPAAGKENRLGIEGDLGFWWIVDEQVENGERQGGSGDAAAAEASGFNFKQGRIAFAFELPDQKLTGLVRIRLEERTDVLDCWGGFHAAPWLNLYVGQMKIPSSAEVLRPDEATDFISRTTFAQNVGDYSLSRTPYISSLMGIRSYNRDLGIALKGSLPAKESPALNYFLMVSNGIGANNFVGGRESNEFLYSNNFGDYFYGARLEVVPIRRIILGGHYSRNHHDDALFQDKKTVVDFDRQVWTTDLQVEFPWGMQVQGMYGKGSMNDFFNSMPYHFDYQGWGAWILQGFFQNRLELGIRYDTFITEFQKDGYQIEQNNWTYGINYRPNPNLRLQLNYLAKNTVDESIDDLDDNIVYLNIQFLLKANIPTAL